VLSRIHTTVLSAHRIARGLPPVTDDEIPSTVQFIAQAASLEDGIASIHAEIASI